MALFGQLSEQIMPQFVTQRALYEVRERPSKMYSWPGTSTQTRCFHFLPAIDTYIFSVHAKQHPHRNPLEHADGGLNLRLLVLPHRLASDRPPRARTRLPRLPLCVDVHALHQHLQPPRRLRHSNSGDSRQYCEHLLYALHRILGVSLTYLQTHALRHTNNFPAWS
jgi:hypothetical protein